MAKGMQLTSSQAQKFGRVAVLYGGQSAEREVSLNSGSAVFDALKKSNVDAHLIDVDGDIIDRLRSGNFDRVFIALHGDSGEDGRIQALLEFLELPFSGSGVQASSIAMDKWLSKQIFTAEGIATPAYEKLSTSSDWDAVIEHLGPNLMIKPAHEGSSIGMSKVSGKQQLIEAFNEASNYDDCVFAESLIEYAEYTVAILGGEVLPPIKLETDHEFYDYDAKYLADDTRYLCPCGLSPEAENDLKQLALSAFEALGCKGWGRVDFMADEKGRFYCLEVNTVPGMTDHSLVPMAAQSAGYSFQELVCHILAQTLEDPNHG